MSFTTYSSLVRIPCSAIVFFETFSFSLDCVAVPFNFCSNLGYQSPIMTTTRRQCDNDATLVRRLEGILRDICRGAALSSAAQVVGAPPIARQLLKGALKELATPGLRADGADTFGTIPDRSVAEERPTSRIQTADTSSCARLERTVPEQIASISVIIGDTVVQLFDSAAVH